jgi:hypothetical protein
MLKWFKNHIFISIDENHTNYGQQPTFQICCILLGMCPLTFCRKESTLCLFMMEQRSGWTKHMPWAMLKTAWHWVFPKLKLEWRWEAGCNSLANLRPAFIIFEDIILHVGSKDKDEKMPLHHSIHPCVNKHQPLVDYRLFLVRPWITTIARWHP